MDFQSKFVLPKKVPVFLNEFVGFMETTRSIEAATAQTFIVAVPDAWQSYIKTGRVRKVKEKKEEAMPLPTSLERALPLVAPTVFKKLQDYIAENVLEEKIRNDLIRIVNELQTALN